jgi:hypothetical protein
MNQTRKAETPRITQITQIGIRKAGKWVFMDDAFVRFGITADVFHVPAERFEHGINEFLA